jgi:phosphate transport system substrate-binding protein
LQNQLLFVGLLATLSPSADRATEISGAGATFPQPFYEKAFNAYRAAEPAVAIRYQGVGSGTGTQALLAKQVDFAASDVQLSDDEQRRSGMAMVHIPSCLGAVAVVVNLPGNPKIRLTRDVLASVFLGRLTRWNARAIAELNPKASLPGLPITVVHRADSSGTSFVFTEFLTKISTDWRAKVGTGREVAWPGGRQAKGNAGVAGLVRHLPGSIGYVELVYAIGNDMTVVAIQNRAGSFVAPTPESVSQAAAHLPEGSSMSLTDTAEEGGYPISSFSWIVLYREQSYQGRGQDRAEALARMLWWLIHDGQKHAADLHYGVLPDPVITRAEAALATLLYRGKPVLVSPSGPVAAPGLH